MSNSEITVPYGYCRCGCGERTKLSKRTRSERGQFKGEPEPYLPLHMLYVDPVDYDVDPDTGCWNWSKSITSNGYGFVRGKRVDRNKLAHRYVYEQQRGPVPDHLDLDHLCRNRKCVNPEHLEPVSRAENLRRGAQGKMTLASIFQMRIVDATTSIPRGETAEIFGVSGRMVTRYLGTNGKGRNLEQRRRDSGVPQEEHRLRPSRTLGPYPAV